MYPIHLVQQPSNRHSDLTYYNSKEEEKYNDAMHKVCRMCGTTVGCDRINYDGPTEANALALSTVKILL